MTYPIASAAAWLGDLDSHTIYGSEKLRSAPVEVKIEGHTAILKTGGREERMHLSTYEEEIESIKARGLGGSLSDEARTELLFTGWQVASHLCELLLGDDPGAMYLGRGSAFRACLDALRKAAK